MGDIFKEQIVKRKASPKDMVIRVLLVLLVFLIFIVALALVGEFAVMIVFLAGFGAAYLSSYLKVEYEYAFTNGEMDIDIIYNQSRRKRMFSAKVSDIDVMMHVDAAVQAHDFQNPQAVLDFSSGEVTADTYAFMINYNTKRTKVIISPNEKMLDAMGTVLSRKLRK